LPVKRSTSDDRVTLKIYDVLGREIATVVDETYKPGEFVARWDGRDTNGNPVVSGIYFYQLDAGAVKKTQKLVVVRSF
jgi:flagellar hook assembly protein FlgD